MPTLFRTGRMTPARCFAATILCLAALSGCVPVSPVPAATPTTTPTVAPVFATDDEALAAAVVAYEGYSAASDSVARDGGANPSRIAEWVSPAWLEIEMKGAADFAQSGYRMIGQTAVSPLLFQRLEQSPEGDVVVGAYACLDVSETTLVDIEGTDITPIERPGQLSLELSFENKSPESTSLVLAGSDTWSGGNLCG